ncbi:MAG: hypothetical protein ABEJ95_04810, partial [Candidatus Nanohalobium sp.]
KCEATEVDECEHIDGNFVDPNDPDVRKTTHFIQVNTWITPQLAFRVQKAADEYTDYDNGDESHPGNRSKLMRKVLKNGVELIEESSDKGTLDEILDRKMTGDEELESKYKEVRKEKQELENKVEDLKEKLSESARERKKLKRRHSIMEKSNDVFYQMLEIIEEEPKTRQEIVEELKKEGLEDGEIPHPVEHEEDATVSGLVEYFLARDSSQRSEKQKIEVVGDKNGRSLYKKKD